MGAGQQDKAWYFAIELEYERVTRGTSDGAALVYIIC